MMLLNVTSPPCYHVSCRRATERPLIFRGRVDAPSRRMAGARGIVESMNQMKIEYLPVASLHPYERNAKIHDEKQIENIANSIKRFGWKQPIVVDADHVVIIGHGRLMAAERLNAETVPVLVADWLTEDEARELRIADNKTNESPWDFERLKQDIKGLKFDGFDFGFDRLGDEISEVNKTDKPDEGTYTCPRCGRVFTEFENGY